MRIGITGVFGVIGTHLLKRLSQDVNGNRKRAPFGN
jgi:nucleoside-diphosphate-sugar epimerase